jgi:hypothetical protein
MVGKSKNRRTDDGLKHFLLRLQFFTRLNKKDVLSENENA